MTRPTEQRLQRLKALAEWHREWVEQALPDAAFRPGEHPTAGSDYSQHHADVDAAAKDEDAFHRRAGNIIAGRTE